MLQDNYFNIKLRISLLVYYMYYAFNSIGLVQMC